MSETNKTGKIGVLKSQLDMPRMVTYDGKIMKIAAGSKTSLLEFDKLGPLPKGIRFIERRA
jgi:hypothetical protein